MKKVAILQSNYIPWKGYFDLIAAVDEFIIYDDMQFTKNDWRNRNKIKTPQGVQWLSIPVGQAIHRRIRDVTVDDRWRVSHWKTLESNYRRAKHFSDIAEWLRPLYADVQYSCLSQVNRSFIEAVCRYLGIQTKISNSWDYVYSAEGKSERVVALCLAAGATSYLTGPSARDYLQESDFVRNDVVLTWFEYSGYPEYSQLWGEFVHNVSILDLLFNCGLDAPKFMNHVGRGSV